MPQKTKSYSLNDANSTFQGQFFKVLIWGGGSNNRKDHAAGKNPRCRLSFLFFFKTRSKSTCLCQIRSKMCPQKRTKMIMMFVFFVLFCCFCRIWLTKCPQTENKKSCRRENRKVSFVFFVVGPPPPPPQY